MMQGNEFFELKDKHIKLITSIVEFEKSTKFDPSTGQHMYVILPHDAMPGLVDLLKHGMLKREKNRLKIGSRYAYSLTPEGRQAYAMVSQ